MIQLLLDPIFIRTHSIVAIFCSKTGINSFNSDLAVDALALLKMFIYLKFAITDSTETAASSVFQQS
jgi:hypothetical protein